MPLLAKEIYLSFLSFGFEEKPAEYINCIPYLPACREEILPFRDL